MADNNMTQNTMQGSMQSNMQSNAIPNEINPNNLYDGQGQQANTGCLQGSCPRNTIDTGYYIPSLTEIASYNPYAPNIGTQRPQNDISQNPNIRPAPGVSNMANMPTNNTSNMQNTPMNNNNMQMPYNGNEQYYNNMPLPATPATTQMNGATMSTIVREDLNMPITDFANPYPITPESIQYLNGYIRTQIGRRLTIDFLIGTNNIVSKTGYLLGVAQNYILINELDTNDITTCDFYNIKFIRFYY